MTIRKLSPFISRVLYVKMNQYTSGKNQQRLMTLVTGGISVDFKGILNSYIDLIGCTARELSEASGVSTATISRYRSGERIPAPDSGHFDKLVSGIIQLAASQPELTFTEETVRELFRESVSDVFTDMDKLRHNFNTLLMIFSVSISELSRTLNYDPSYLSKIRSGKRQPADPGDFSRKISGYFVHRFSTDNDIHLISELTGVNISALSTEADRNAILIRWLLNGNSQMTDPLTDFLKKLNEFNLNEYIKTIRFDELKVPSIPFQLPGSRTYHGLQEIMDSELDFLKATVLSKSEESVIMYSDMPMEEMAKDPEFPKKWMFGMALMLKKGLHLYQIHNLNRTFPEMMLGLEGWIPMYMTGQISPYYLKDNQNRFFSHLLKVSGAAALSGEAIVGHHENGIYYLTKNKKELAIYRKQAEDLLSKATPLMEIFLKDSRQAYETFLLSDSKTSGKRRAILSVLPLYTISDELLENILEYNNIPENEQNTIIDYVRKQKKRIFDILSHDEISDEISAFSEREFRKFTPALSLSGLFFEKDIFYSWDTYQEHLILTKQFAEKNSNYNASILRISAYRNIQILIHEGKWVIVSKNRTPVIHFLIRHPRMQRAFENMTIPIIEE